MFVVETRLLNNNWCIKDCKVGSTLFVSWERKSRLNTSVRLSWTNGVLHKECRKWPGFFVTNETTSSSRCQLSDQPDVQSLLKLFTTTSVDLCDCTVHGARCTVHGARLVVRWRRSVQFQCHFRLCMFPKLRPAASNRHCLLAFYPRSPILDAPS